MHGERTLRTDGLDFAEWREAKKYCVDSKCFRCAFSFSPASRCCCPASTAVGELRVFGVFAADWPLLLARLGVVKAPPYPVPRGALPKRRAESAAPWADWRIGG